MKRYFAAGLTAFAILAAACSPDTMAPTDKDKSPVGGPFAVTVNADLQATIIAQLTCLYDQGLLPNKNSTLGKFNNIVDLLAADDLAGARAAADNLIRFIEQKFFDYTGLKDTAVPCGPPLGNSLTLRQLKDGIIVDKVVVLAGVVDNINTIVTVCVPTTADPFCHTDVNNGGFLYLPTPPGDIADIKVEKLTYTPIQFVFDEYANRIKITVVRNDGSTGDYRLIGAGTSVAVVCWDDATAPDVTIRGRLRLIAKHQDLAETKEFLPPPPILQAIQDYAAGLCDPPPGSPAIGFWQSPLAKRLGGFLLPANLMAQITDYDFGGVGGSAERFSDFTIGDPGLSAFGGVGGSAERFSPMASGPMTTGSFDGANTLTGQAGDDETDVTTGLPWVKVTTALGDAVPGVDVTFTLEKPTSAAYKDQPEATGATLCPAAAKVTTDADGKATLPCINFGTTPGYKNLHVTFDPASPALPLDGCMIAPDGSCAADPTSVSVNFLVETKVGDPAELKALSPPTTGQLGEPFTIVLQVTDNSTAKNPIKDATVTLETALAEGGTLGCAVAGCMTPSPSKTGSDGKVTFSNLKVTGLNANKLQTLVFKSGTLSASVPITFASGKATSLTPLSPPTAGQLGQPFAVVLQVTDADGNAVKESAVTLEPTLAEGGSLECAVADCLTPSPSKSGSDGKVTFSNLKVTGSGANKLQTLVFKSDALSASVPITFTSGNAAALTVTGGPVSANAGVYPTGGSVPTLKAWVTDTWGNKILGENVAVAAPGGYTFSGTTPVGTAVVTTGVVTDTVATFGDLKLGGTAGAVNLTFTREGLAPKTVTVNLSPGPAASLAVNPSPTTAATNGAVPTLTATVKDGWNNNVGSGVSVSVSAPAGTILNGGTPVSPVSTTSGGTAAFSNLVITSSSLEIVPLTFSASPATATVNVTRQLTLAACAAAGATKKTDLAAYRSTLSGYVGVFSIPVTTSGTLKSVQVNMSVTGQKSGVGDYPTDLRVYTDGARGTLITTLKPSTQTGKLQLPGNNSTPSQVTFTGPAVAVSGTVFFELQITAASTRTFQVWYNTAPTGDCSNSKLYTPPVPAAIIGTTLSRNGLHLNVRNY